jgi:hypothetical protein
MHPWVVTQEPPQGMAKDPKMAKSFSWAFYIKCFHNYNFFFMFINCILIYGLNFILKNLKIAKNCIVN